ncbi:hypothetical protein KAT24_00095 [Candidatus Pacearchaeota archaeon]|nr:hypothetical protein [Candidatus Pacearchaeota archaeon]
MPKKEYDSEINGIPFKTIIRTKQNGEIIDVMNKPNKKLFTEDLHISGTHLVADKPEENHYDHFEGDKKWIERETKENPLKFDMKISKDKKSVLI